MKQRLATARLPSQLGVDALPPTVPGIPTARISMQPASALITVPDRALATITDTPRAVGAISFARAVAAISVPDQPSAEIGDPDMTQQNLALKRGDTNVFAATITIASVALDVSAYDIWCTAKYNKDDLDINALFQVTKAAGAIVVSGAGNNIATITVAASLTLALTTDVSVFYDVQIKSPGGVVTTVAEGTMLISKDVTRAV